MKRVQVRMSAAELEWLAASASGSLAQRARNAAEQLNDTQWDMLMTDINSTWDAPLEAELQSQRPLFPLWELSKEQLKELVEYLS